MDELDLLREARPDPAPAPDATARARSELRASFTAADPGHAAPAARTVRTVAAAGAAGDEEQVMGSDAGVNLVPFDVAPRRRSPKRPRIVAVAAAVVLAVVGFATMRDRERTPLDTGPSAAPSATADPVADAALACGSTLPIDVPTLEGFTGPTRGPGGDGRAAPQADQLTLHWSSPTGSVEVRWPADATAIGGAVLRDADDRQPDSPPSRGSFVSAEPQAVPSGRHAVRIDIADGAWSAVERCWTLQVVIADADPQRARAVGSRLLPLLENAGTPDSPLVTGHTAAEAPPEVPPCNAPPGVEHQDRVGGPVDQGTAATAEAALQAFVDSKRVPDTDPFGVPTTRPGVVDRGYVATSLPDGSIAFVATVEQGVTVVHAVQVDGGWTVDWWEATGC